MADLATGDLSNWFGTPYVRHILGVWTVGSSAFTSKPKDTLIKNPLNKC